MEREITQDQFMNRIDQEEEIDLLELFSEILHRWKLVLLAMLAFATLAGAFHLFFVEPSYKADTKIYITNTDSIVSFSDLQLSSALTDDYANIIKSRTVLKRVIKEMKLDMDFEELSELITVENPDGTHIIQISVTCNDMELSKNIANALLNIGVEQIYQIIGSSEPTIIDYAEADAVEEIMPSIFKYLAIGAFAGAVLACAIIVVMTLMNTSIKTEEDVDKYLHVPVLSAVPYYQEGEL